MTWGGGGDSGGCKAGLTLEKCHQLALYARLNRLVDTRWQLGCVWTVSPSAARCPSGAESLIGAAAGATVLLHVLLGE